MDAPSAASRLQVTNTTTHSTYKRHFLFNHESERLETEYTTSVNSSVANTTADVVPSILQRLVEPISASAAFGRRDTNFNDSPTPNRFFDGHETLYSGSRHQGVPAYQILLISVDNDGRSEHFRRRLRTSPPPTTSRTSVRRTVCISPVKS